MASSRGLLISLTVLVLLLLGLLWPHGQQTAVRVITDENWRELLEGEWMIEFDALYCPACQNLQPEWESFAEWGEDLFVNVAKVDVAEQTGTISLKDFISLPIMLKFILF
uniref:Thioredoxin domain-containing protein n=1 Tax=Sciurus vulgaris TaxID=55149 RepID=A0A8D2JFW0_SCIVU